MGIQDPAGSGYAATVALTDCFAVTSGGYQRYFVAEDGTVYRHILDPRTGRPADSDLLSVTVISDDGTAADAYSTALYVMGEQEAVSFWRAHGGFDLILITADGRLLYTPDLSDAITAPEGCAYDFQPIAARACGLSRWDALVAAAVVALAVVTALLFYRPQDRRRRQLTAVITQHGQTVRTVAAHRPSTRSLVHPAGRRHLPPDRPDKRRRRVYRRFRLPGAGLRPHRGYHPGGTVHRVPAGAGGDLAGQRLVRRGRGAGLGGAP